MHYPASELVIDPVLMRKYGTPGPRYTSYPTADRFVEAFGEAELRQWLGKRTIGGITRPLSVYVHRDRKVSAKYINCIEREMAAAAQRLGAEREIAEVHCGGVVATSSAKEIEALVAAIDRHFDGASACDRTIEADARQGEPGRLRFLAGLGFNRVTFGATDLELARSAIAEARASGFRSVSLELVYGRPRQTLDGFNRSIDRLLDLAPDRVVLQSFAKLSGSAGISAELKLELLTLAVSRLTRAGYLYLGMEHFVRPDDDLAAAQRQGRLRRGFRGYSTQAGDLLGIGVSAIGRMGPAYYQNGNQLGDYCAAIEEGRLPVARGLELTADDLVRGAVIQSLLCQSCVSIEAIEIEHLVDFRRYFAAELADLRPLEQDGIVETSPDWIMVTAKGRLVVRAICMLFDRYLRERTARAACEKVM